MPIALAGDTLAALQGVQLRLDLRITLEQLGATEVKRAQGLLEGKEMLGAPVALQTLDHVVQAGVSHWQSSTSLLRPETFLT